MPTTVVKTIRASGGDYTTLSAWEAANQGDLVTADEVRVAECYNDWPSGLDDQVTIDGSTTDATRYLKITVAAGHRHNGTPQSGFFIVKFASYLGVIQNSDSYSVFEWLDAKQTSTVADSNAFYGVVTTGVVWKYCIGAVGVSGQRCFRMNSTNTLIGCLALGVGAGFTGNNYWSPTLLNCVAVNCSSGFAPGGANSSVIAKNCVAYNNTTNYGTTGFNAASTNNASSSASDDAPGGNSVWGVVSADFVDVANNDFHLAAGSALIGAGVNLYSDFTIDVDGDTWPSSGAWDIGFDYYVASGGITHNLEGAATAQVTATGDLTVPANHALEGAATAQVTATGDLTVPANHALEGAAGAAATATGRVFLNGVFASSTFTAPDNVSLAAAEAEWVKSASLGTKALGISGNQLYGSELGANSLHWRSETPASPDYSVSLDVTANAANMGGSSVGVVGRYDGAAYYSAKYQGATTNEFQLHRNTFSGGLVLLGTYPAAITAGQTFNLRLEMIGTSIKVYLDGALILAATDSAVASAGNAGVSAYTDTAADWRADNFVAAHPVASAVDLGGAAAAQAAAQAALSVSVPLAAASVSVATAAGALSVSIPLAGAAQSVADAAGDLSVTGDASLAGAATATASASGGLSLSIPLAGAAVAQALAAAGITQGVPLSGAAIAEALAAAALGVSSNLSGAAVAEAVAAAALSHGVPLSGAAIAEAVATAELAGGVNLSGAATAEAFASAGLALSKALAASALSEATATGGMTINISLSGAAIAEAAATASLTTIGGASLAGAAAAIAAASGALTHDVPLTGASLAVSSASGNLTQLVPLSGAAASASTATGGLDVSVQLAGAALAEALAAAGLTHIISSSLAGAAAGEATAQGSVTLRVNLDGAAVAQAIAAGALSADGLLTTAAKEWTIGAAPRNWTIARAARNWTIEQAARNWRVQA